MPSGNPVDAHYGHADLVERVLAALVAGGRDVDALTLEDLAPIEEFHIGGREASARLAELAGLAAGQRVLDVGAGIGGPARFLAHDLGCRVTALDLTEAFCAVARELNRRTGLADRVEVVHGNALDLPFPDGSFDVVWTQHAAMNIEDRERLYAELRRVLPVGGTLALNDVVAGPGGEPYYPVPWAPDASISFLRTAGGLRDVLERSGFRVQLWNDRTAYAIAFADRIAERFAQGAPPVGLHVIVPELPAKLANVRRGLAEDSLALVETVLEAI